MNRFSIFFGGTSYFHSSSSAAQRPDHRMFGQVSWDQVESGKYAIIDPLDPHNILYLSPREYLSNQKTWLANDIAVVVLATPQDKRPSSTDTQPKASPPRRSVPGLEASGRAGSKARIWSSFESPLKKFVNYFLGNKPDLTEGVSKMVAQPAVEVNKGNLVDLILEWGQLLHFRLLGLSTGRGFQDALALFAAHLLAIFQSQGGLMMTKRMKIYAIVIKMYLGGEKMKSTHTLGVRVRLSGGLPTALPARARAVLRSKSVLGFRLWISVMHSYKAMVVKHPLPDIGSIVSSAPEIPISVLSEFQRFCTLFPAMFKDVTSRFPRPNFTDCAMHLSFKNGPNGMALTAIPLDTLAWVFDLSHRLGWICELKEGSLSTATGPLELIRRTRVLLESLLSKDLEAIQTAKASPLLDFIINFGVTSWFVSLFEPMLLEVRAMLKAESAPKGPDPMAKYAALKTSNPAFYNKIAEKMKAKFPTEEAKPDGILSRLMFVVSKTHRAWTLHPSSRGVFPFLTKLAFLEEPAGKVRTIALVDWWSQQVLKPVHQWLFQLLKSLPTDATFDQEGRVRAFSKRVGKDVFSYDLKSATEMIPQTLYTIVLSGFLGQGKADSFLRILVDRWFHYREGKSFKEPIRYRRGQPMGALGSWASMALVHHAILQFAAFRVNKYPFWDYLILGDDIVISGKEVAESYQSTCADLFVPISLPKSLISHNGTFDFASQILQGSKNFSPLSLREEISAYEPGRRVEAALRLVRRGFIDLSSGGWFSAYLKLVVNPTIYKQIVVSRNQGKFDPAAKAVQAQTLGSLSVPHHRFGLDVKPELTVIDLFRAAMPRMDLFRNGFETIFGLGKDPNMHSAIAELAFEALAYKAKFVKARFKLVETRLLPWRDAIEEKGFLGAASTLLSSDIRFLAPLISSFGMLEQKFTDYLAWKKANGPMVENVVLADTYRSKLSAKQLSELTISFWPVIEDAELRLVTDPEVVLGVKPLTQQHDLLKPSWSKVVQAERFFYRLGVWSELVALAGAPGDLGLPGSSDPDWHQTNLEAIKEGTTPPIG